MDLVVSLLAAASSQIPSYSALSYFLFSHNEKDVSRQRLHKVMSSDNFVVFFSSVVNRLLQDQILPAKNSYKKKFKRILVQDSTILKLPKKLFQFYSGVSNASATVANCRIQVCVNLLTNFIESFGADSYAINDLKARDYIHPEKGDLVLRDRGYYAIDQVLKFSKQGVHFIIRHKSNNLYYDESGSPIDLTKVLSKANETTLKVRLTKEQGPTLNLFVKRVDKETLSKRIRSARLNTKGRTLSKRTIQHLHWTIFISNLDQNEYNIDSIWQLYSLRWRIEILFKALKTHLNLDSLQNVSNNQLKVIILARIALSCMIITKVYNPLRTMLKKKKSNHLISLIKLIGNLLSNLDQLVNAILYFKSKRMKKQANKKFIQKLVKSSAYESRQRLNYENQLEIALLS
jgi:IS4 transposase